MSLLFALAITIGTAVLLAGAVVPGALVALLVSRTFADPVVAHAEPHSFTSVPPPPASGRDGPRAIRECPEEALDHVPSHSSIRFDPRRIRME